MNSESTDKKGKLRAMTFDQAEEERVHYSLKKTIGERLEYLQHLRILNYGEKAIQPIVRKVQMIEGTRLK